MTPPLLLIDIEILNRLNEGSGNLPTRRIAMTILKGIGITRYEHSAHIRQRLLHLKKLGLADYMDHKKPVVWKITPLGKRVLSQRTSDQTDP